MRIPTLIILSLATASAALARTQVELQTEFVTDSVDNPVHLAAPPGDARLFIAEQWGRVWIVMPDGTRLATPFINLAGQVQTSFGAGLLGFTFHPDYAQNGHVYAFYTASGAGAGGDSVLARLTRSANDPNRVDPASLVELLRIPQPNLDHAGGSMEFGPDGFLYLALGDGGVQTDPACLAQSGGLFGGVLRLDVDSAFPYAIPPGNPFVGVPGVADELYHRGLRHPWRLAFDEETGDLYIGDNGQDLWEELDVAPSGSAGLNFGWNQMEGTHCFAGAGCAASVPPCNDPAYTNPIHEYAHGALGVSIIAGRVYRGGSIPGFEGHFLYTDWLSGRVWSLRWDGSAVQDLVERTAELAPGGGRDLDRPVAFGKDGFGELYILEHGDDEVFRIVRDCGVARFCVASPNVTGGVASAGWSGSVSVASNDLVLSVAGAPPNTFGIFFYAPLRSAPQPLGNGQLCLAPGGTGFFRQPVLAANAQGAMSLALNYSAGPMASGPGAVAPGMTWNFQAWYRDIGGPVGAVFNLTDGLSVLFCP